MSSHVVPDSLTGYIGTGKPFTLLTPSDTDIWRKPPSRDVFNAPHLLTSVHVSSFHRARVTVTADWVRQYDQGGLLFLPPQKGAFRPWIKSGIEFHDEEVDGSQVVDRSYGHVRPFCCDGRGPDAGSASVVLMQPPTGSIAIIPDG